jgi:alpha-1,2-mannosyltransferase
VVFPPCDTTSLRSIPLEDPRQPVILSIAQFRPEKDHARQVDAFFRLVFGVRGAEAAAAAAAVAAAAAAAGPWARKRVAVYPNARLALVGGVRDEGDKQRLEALRQMGARRARVCADACVASD